MEKTAISAQDSEKEKPYAIVNFENDDLVGIVATSWLNEDWDDVFCPPTRYDESRVLKMKPDREIWKHFAVHVYKTSGSWTNALKYKNHYVETSHMEDFSDEDGGEQGKGRRKKKPRKLFADDADVEDEDETEIKRKAKKTEKKQDVKTCISKQVEVKQPLPVPPTIVKAAVADKMDNGSLQLKSTSHDLATDTEVSLPSSAVDVQPLNELIAEPLSPSAGSKSPGSSVSRISLLSTPADLNEFANIVSVRFCDAVKELETKNNMILSEVRQLRQTVTELQTRIANVHPAGRESQQSDAAAAAQYEEICPEPLTQKHQLNELERLLNNKDSHRKLMTMLTTVGGRNLPDGMRNMMRRLADNSVWSQFSLKGRKGKTAFKDYKLLTKMIVDVCVKSYGCTNQKAMTEIAEFLKHAPHRTGGPKAKVTEKESGPLFPDIEDDE